MGFKAIFFRICVSVCVLAYFAETIDPREATSCYDFVVKDTYHKNVPLSKFRGYVVLFVNIASNDGLAKAQYAGLRDLRNRYHSKGLRIVALPSNHILMMPEPNGKRMENHLKSENVTFDLILAKGGVNGESVTPLFWYLKENQTGILGSSIKWFFTKFLVNKNGQVVKRFAPTTSPQMLSSLIEKLLNE